MTLTAQLRQFLPQVYAQYGPLNARQYMYRAEAAGLLTGGKSHSNDNVVNRVLVELREKGGENGGLPWSAVLDSARTWEPLDTDADETNYLDSWISAFRGSWERFAFPVWREQDAVPVVVTEKAGLVPYFESVTRNLDVSVYAIKGQAGKSHMHEEFVPWVEDILAGGRGVRLFYLGDYDDDGFQIEATLNETLQEFGLDLATERVALTAGLVASQRIRLDPGNRKSSVHKKFIPSGQKAELEALDANALRGLIEGRIRGLIDADVLQQTREEMSRAKDRLRLRVAELTRGWPAGGSG